MFKTDIRTIYKDMRSDLTLKEMNHLSEKITFSLFTNFDFHQIKTIHIYLPMLDKGEINTWNIIDNIWKFFPHISIITSKIHVTDEKSILTHFYIHKNTSYKRNTYNILEPFDSQEYKENHFDMILAPLLAYDKKGYRVGYGKGFYDKLLHAHSYTFLVGMSFFEPVYEIKDIHNFDIPLDYCVTPNKIYKFK